VYLDSLMRALFTEIARNIVPLFEQHRDFYVSANVPPIIIGSGRLRPMLESLGLLPHAGRLVCEITERQALTETGRAALISAHELGIRIAIDDFGTGQSGIKQLAGIPLDLLKLDKGQIDPLMQDPTADRLLRAVVAFASALRVKVVAEGVERPAQAFFLRAAGVDAGQGWLWSKAVPAHQLQALIESGLPQLRDWR
jgi:EAL domain-containing protein (putative c-di-GMP-specific phosphodiesterase class I)